MKLTPSPDLSVCPPGRDDSSSLSLSLDAGMPAQDERCQFDLHRGHDSQEKGGMTIGMMLFPLSLSISGVGRLVKRAQGLFTHRD